MVSACVSHERRQDRCEPRGYIREKDIGMSPSAVIERRRLRLRDRLGIRGARSVSTPDLLSAPSPSPGPGLVYPVPGTPTPTPPRTPRSPLLLMRPLVAPGASDLPPVRSPAMPPSGEMPFGLRSPGYGTLNASPFGLLALAVQAAPGLAVPPSLPPNS
jgi:hypothetical protein